MLKSCKHQKFHQKISSPHFLPFASLHFYQDASVSVMHPGGSGYGFKNVQRTSGNYSVFPGMEKKKANQNTTKMNNQKLPQCNIVNDTFFSKYCDSIRSNKLSCILSNSLFHPHHGIKKFNQTCQHSDTNIHC